MNLYITLEEIRNAIKAGASEAANDDLLLLYAEVASRLLDNEANRKFYPRLETRYYDHPVNASNKRRIMLDDDLVSLSSFTNGDGSDLPTTEFLQHPINEDVKYALELEPGSTYSWELDLTNGKYQKACLAVAGYWGFHMDWSNAWDSVDTVGDTGGIDASSTSLTVSDIDGDNSYGYGPRISRGDLIQIESEMCYVTAAATDTNIATLVRAVNGTTAAAHANGKVVEVFRVWPMAKHIVRRLAVWLYKQNFAPLDVDRPAITPDGVTILPMALPKDIQYMISLIRRPEA